MNYLAHVFLARPTPEARLGALLGDFTRGLDLAAFPAATHEAVLEHRAVDAFVDSHPRVRAQRERFPIELRRFAGILLDVFDDHFLVLHWERFSAVPLAEVTGSLYGALDAFAERLPPRLAAVAPHMTAHDWLGSYGDERNVERALEGIARRFRRPVPLAAGIHELRRRRDELERHTLALLPEVQAFVAERRGDVDSHD